MVQIDSLSNDSEGPNLITNQHRQLHKYNEVGEKVVKMRFFRMHGRVGRSRNDLLKAEGAFVKLFWHV